jgi:hypothetical protein
MRVNHASRCSSTKLERGETVTHHPKPPQDKPQSLLMKGSVHNPFSMLTSEKDRSLLLCLYRYLSSLGMTSVSVSDRKTSPWLICTPAEVLGLMESGKRAGLTLLAHGPPLLYPPTSIAGIPHNMINIDSPQHDHTCSPQRYCDDSPQHDQHTFPTA